jgi:hypothetical protein
MRKVNKFLNHVTNGDNGFTPRAFRGFQGKPEAPCSRRTQRLDSGIPLTIVNSVCSRRSPQLSPLKVEFLEKDRFECEKLI